jgi:hypothetical protein
MIIEVIPSKNGEFFQKKWKDSMILFCRVTARCQTHWSPHDMAPNTWENGEKRGKVPPNYGFRIVFVFFGSGFGFFLAFFPGTMCLVFATVWN